MDLTHQITIAVGTIYGVKSSIRKFVLLLNQRSRILGTPSLLYRLN